MKITNFSSFDFEGGAARAAHRIHRGLISIGIDSEFYTQRKTSDDLTVVGPVSAVEKALAIVRPKLDKLPLTLLNKNTPGEYTFGSFSSRAVKKFTGNADIVHLHWISNGFVSVRAIEKLTKPIVWTLHDMWAFTGGCHYDDDCGRYREKCGMCPQLNSERQTDLSSWNLSRKKSAWRELRSIVVAPSRWLADCAGSSAVFKRHRIEVIPYGVDLNIYKPLEKAVCRDILGLPREEKLILFGAIQSTVDQRKGFRFLRPAIQILARQSSRSDWSLLVFGAPQSRERPDLGLPTHYVGRQYDDISMNVLYAAADVMVVPSKQDNLPNTVLESLACGTPVVAFDINGLPDMIDHCVNGYLARPFEPEDLAAGIAWVLADDERRGALSEQALEKARSAFDLPLIARRYESLYSDLLAGRK